MKNEVANRPHAPASIAATAVKLTVVAPTYNEAENVGPLIGELQQALRGLDYEILICDDNSPDLTWARVEELSRRDPRIRVLRRIGDRGLSPAVLDGFSAAAGEVLACIDADLQHDPKILPQMLRALEKDCDLAVGSRYVAGGGTLNWSWPRRFVSWTATKMAEWMLGVALHDPMSGYFMLRREDFLCVRPHLKPDGFKILLEISAHLKPARVCEVPYTFRCRRAGESKLSSKVMFAYLRQLWRLSLLTRLRTSSAPPTARPAAGEPRQPADFAAPPVRRSA